MPESAVESVEAVTLAPKVSTGVDRRHSVSGPAVAVALTFCALAVRFFLLVDKYAVNVFFDDQWLIENALLFQKHSVLEIFLWQHGLHRQGLGNLLLAAFEPLTKWNGRVEAFLIATILGFACAAAIWLKVRLFGALEYSDAAIPLLFFTPTQWGIFLGALNPSYAPLPTLLVVLYCLAWTVHGPRRYGLVLFTNLLLIYTGYGVLMGLITPAILAIDCFRSRTRITIAAFVISILSLAVFFIGYQHSPSADTFAPQPAQPFEYVAFVVLLFSAFFQIPFAWLIPSLFVGAAFALATACFATHSAVSVLLLRKDMERSRIVLALLAFSLLFCCATAFGRASYGAPAPRYMTYMIVAGFGIYLASLSVADRNRRRICVGALAVAGAWGGALIGPQERGRMEMISSQRRIWRDCYLLLRNVEACDSRSGAPIAWTPEPADLKAKLDYLEHRRINLFVETLSNNQQKRPSSGRSTTRSK